MPSAYSQVIIPPSSGSSSSVTSEDLHNIIELETSESNEIVVEDIGRLKGNSSCTIIGTEF